MMLNPKDRTKLKKITEEGQPCWHCGTPVLRREHRPNWKPKKRQPYYFKWWFYCWKCKAVYHVEEAKHWLMAQPQPNVDQQYRERLAREE
jgi:hypothetical protein